MTVPQPRAPYVLVLGTAHERRKVFFTHLNHTNPAADPDSDAAAAIRRAGMSVAHDGLLIEL